MRHLLIAILALAAIVWGLWRLVSASAGLEIIADRFGTMPITLFKQTGVQSVAYVVIAHGFAGSQQLMRPLAVTLARNGYAAVTFDLPGHGRNPTPLSGGLLDPSGSGQALLQAVGDVLDFVKRAPAFAGELALLGHSMASDVVVRYAQTHPEIAATIALSLFSSQVTANSPRNLLIIDGALEPAFFRDAGLAIVAMAAGDAAKPETTYGDFANGSARRLVLARGAEHIGVLFSSDTLTEATAWLNHVFNHSSNGFVDAEGRWLLLLFGGLVALARPLARLLPQAATPARGMGLSGRHTMVALIAPTVLTPLMLWLLPTHFLPILLGDYLALHFGLFGLLTFAASGLLRPPPQPPRNGHVNWLALAIGVAAMAAYSLIGLGVPIDMFVSNFWPTPQRLAMIAVIFIGTLIYFVADEWMTRGETAPAWTYTFSNVCFLASLALAIALDPKKLFFLIIIVPAILLLFLVFGLFSTWAFRRAQHPLVGALANAIVFAWAMGVTFPIVG